MDQYMLDAAHVIQYEIIVQEGIPGQVSPTVQVTERSWLFDPDTFDVVEVPSLPDYIDNFVHQQQGGIEIDELEIGAAGPLPLGHSSPTSPPNPFAGSGPLAASSPQSPIEGHGPLATSSPPSPLAHHDATFHVYPGQGAPGLNETFDVGPGHAAPGLDDTYDVIPGYAAPGPNETFDVGPGHAAPGLDDTYDVIPAYAAPGLNETFDVGPGHAAPGLDDSFGEDPDLDIQDDLEVAPGYALPGLNQHPAFEEEPDLDDYEVENDNQEVAPGLNSTFELPQGGVSEIPPGWETPMSRINQNRPPRVLFVDIEGEAIAQRQEARFQRAVDRVQRRRERRRPMMAPEACMPCRPVCGEEPRRDRRGDGGGRLRM